MSVDIELKNFGITFQKKVIFKDFNLQIHTGENVVLTGPSGLGKSSILRALLGFIPFLGQALIFNEEVTPLQVWKLRNKIAFLTQEATLESMSVINCLKQPFSYRNNQNLKFEEQKMHDYLNVLRLPEEVLDKKTDDLSGGEKQRIAFILALLLKREILFLDEPTSALDEISKLAMIDLLRKENKTVLAISHDSVFINFMNKRIEMKRGNYSA